MSTAEGWRRIVDVVPVGAGLVAGVVAYLVGYVATFALLVLDATLGPSGGNSGGTPDAFVEFLGTVFYGAHFVAVSVDSVLGLQSVNMLSRVDIVLPDFAYQLVPVLALGLAGFFVARRVDERLQTHLDGARAGAAVTIGYLPLVAIGATVFSFSGEASGSQFDVWTPLLESMLRAGLIYPLVLGALGGLGYYAYRTRGDSA